MIRLSLKANILILILMLMGCVPYVNKTVDVPSMLDRYIGRKINELPGSEKFIVKSINEKHDSYSYHDKRCNIVLVVNKNTKAIESWRHTDNAKLCKPYYVYGGQSW